MSDRMESKEQESKTFWGVWCCVSPNIW